MQWLIGHRWQILSCGLALVVLGLVLAGPGTGVRLALTYMGVFLTIWAVFAVALSIPMTLRSWREAHRRPGSN